MVNAPQSSRIAGSTTRSMFPDVGAGVIKAPSYFAEKTITQAGENDIQIKQKEKANGLHYIVGAALIAGLVYYASTKLD